MLLTLDEAGAHHSRPPVNARRGGYCTNMQPRIAYLLVNIAQSRKFNKPAPGDPNMPVPGVREVSFQQYRSIRRSAADHNAELLIDAAPERAKGDSLLLFHPLDFGHPEDAGEPSYVFACAIRLV